MSNAVRLRSVAFAAAFAMVMLPASGAHAQAVAGYQQVVVPATVPAGQSATIIAICPQGKQVVGGGFSIGSADDVVVLASLPADANGTPTVDRWRVSVRNTNTDSGRPVTATANCVVGGRPGYELRPATVSVPSGAQGVAVNVRCTAGKKVLSGGFLIQEPIQLFHSDPNDGSSNQIDNGWNLSANNPSTAGPVPATVVAVCVSSSIAGYEQRNSTDGTIAGNTTRNIGASCTSGAGKRVTGGAFRVETPTAVRVYSSEPSNGASPVVDGWNSFMRNLGTPVRIANGVVAICVDSDDAAPETTIASGPAGPTNNTTPTFTFSANEGAVLQCSLDGGRFTTCTSPVTTAALAVGDHTFAVVATDLAGNPDPTPASRAFTIDLTAPETTITSAPTSPTSDNTPTFAFSASEAGSTFVCRVDAAAFAACTSPFTTAALAPGAHTFEVAATDPAGNPDATPASTTVTVTLLPIGDKDGDGIPDALDTSDASVGPTLAKTAVAQVKSGVVLIRRPAGASSRSSRQALQRAAAPSGYVPLKGAEVIPIGSVLDTQKGRVTLTTASSTKTGAARPTQKADFYQGVFQIRQARAKKPVTEARLRSSNFAKQCPSSSSPTKGAQAASAAKSSASKKVVSRLTADGKGRFRTKGRNSAATVRGTVWLTQERCDGTLTKVVRGSVTVRDLRARRTVIVRAPKAYLARATRATVKTKKP